MTVHDTDDSGVEGGFKCDCIDLSREFAPAAELDNS